jgi:hypothetical protein
MSASQGMVHDKRAFQYNLTDFEDPAAKSTGGKGILLPAY